MRFNLFLYVFLPHFMRLKFNSIGLYRTWPELIQLKVVVKTNCCFFSSHWSVGSISTAICVIIYRFSLISDSPMSSRNCAPRRRTTSSNWKPPGLSVDALPSFTEFYRVFVSLATAGRRTTNWAAKWSAWRRTSRPKRNWNAPKSKPWVVNCFLPRFLNFVTTTNFGNAQVRQLTATNAALEKELTANKVSSFPTRVLLQRDWQWFYFGFTSQSAYLAGDFVLT